MQLGSISVTTQSAREERLSMLLWGRPACGKTVLASTAPGKKLWILFDPNGTASIAKRDDILIADFSTYSYKKLHDFKQGGSIERDLIALIKSEKIDTVVVDSLTTFTQQALLYAIDTYNNSPMGKTTKATLEMPGLGAYGGRSTIVTAMAMMIELAARSSGCHVIFIAHETDDVNESGVTFVIPSIRGKSAEEIPPRISEIWRMEDTGKERLVYVRSTVTHKPMRSRMFLTPDGVSRFRVTYDQDKGAGDGIEAWYEKWKSNGFNKIGLPG